MKAYNRDAENVVVVNADKNKYAQISETQLNELISSVERAFVDNGIIPETQVRIEEEKIPLISFEAGHTKGFLGIKITFGMKKTTKKEVRFTPK